MFDVNPIALKFHHADLERSIRNAREPREVRRSPNKWVAVVVIFAVLALMTTLSSLYPVIGA